ncbi:MAG: DNA polymerase III subunit epsilon [Gammaproteobacteria bacterium]|nr:DNA polymerase III subunit epsilon [Gammaproteobacteria bacterium]MCP4088873.1 DNA polymerase III subunit epsilon [Gammaproteobacteria bacterium]MCP4274889.1 DNA polymerase III subunit epsilon [Gammaproteobacteria bacterium]MCP4832044.1 DNA polymerase III subunit epsilon [Gammaproteobacteria bacterium]MCP4928355.1 DNA polymerase III subunit epsilon [Gammaproteobacteria bacterium]
MRQVVLDTETTGLDWERGHRIIEIGCIEILNRRKTDVNFHCYINPEREVDEAAQEVHGMSHQDLVDKPVFADIAQSFLDFIGDAELIIHNASFDVGFLDNELGLAGRDEAKLINKNQILDTLTLARQIHPGQRNSLDALCKRYGVDNSKRDLHGALLDARLLADVYLALTGGQGALSLDASIDGGQKTGPGVTQRVDRNGMDLVVVHATPKELQQHNAQLDLIEAAGTDGALWRSAKA